MKYRKKPIVIEAIQLEKGEANIRKVLQFLGQKVELKTSIDAERFSDYCFYVEKDGIKINTLEGTMTANIGDYVIKGVNGEFYPCKPDIFEKTYEKPQNSVNSKFNFELLKKGIPLKRKDWGGYWKWQNNTIMLHCKDGVTIDIRETKDVDFTISNMFADDWEIATNENCLIKVK